MRERIYRREGQKIQKKKLHAAESCIINKNQRMFRELIGPAMPEESSVDTFSRLPGSQTRVDPKTLKTPTVKIKSARRKETKERQKERRIGPIEGSWESRRFDWTFSVSVEERLLRHIYRRFSGMLWLGMCTASLVVQEESSIYMLMHGISRLYPGKWDR